MHRLILNRHTSNDKVVVSLRELKRDVHLNFVQSRVAHDTLRPECKKMLH